MEVPGSSRSLLVLCTIVIMQCLTVQAVSRKDPMEDNPGLSRAGYSLTFAATYEEGSGSKISFKCARHYVVGLLGALGAVENHLTQKCAPVGPLTVTVSRSARVALKHHQMTVNPVINITSSRVHAPRLWRNLSACADFITHAMTKDLAALETTLDVELLVVNGNKKCEEITMKQGDPVLKQKYCIGTSGNCNIDLPAQVATSTLKQDYVRTTLATTSLPKITSTMSSTSAKTTKFELLQTPTQGSREPLAVSTADRLKVSLPSTAGSPASGEERTSYSGVAWASNSPTAVKSSILLVVMVMGFLATHIL